MNYLTVLIFLMSIVAAVYGGFLNFNCGNGTLTLGCTQDCQQQHGSDTGICGDMSNGDYNCFCENRSGRVRQRSNLQCKEMTDGYRNICTHDCICSHGADGGRCDFDLGVCYCENYRKNPNSMGCPAKSGAEWLAITKELIKIKS